MKFKHDQRDMVRFPAKSYNSGSHVDTAARKYRNEYDHLENWWKSHGVNCIIFLENG